MEPLLLDLLVYTAANKFIIKPLENEALSRFVDRCATEWTTDTFAAVVALVYRFDQPCYATLKNTILSTITANMHELLDNESKYAPFHEMMQSAPGFSAELARAISKAKPKEVFVDKVVEKIVEKPVDKIKYVDKIVNVEKIVEKPVEKIEYVDKIVEKPGRDPTMTYYVCPTCLTTFAYGSTPSKPNTGFGCPFWGCYKVYEPNTRGWWNKYKK